MVLASGDSKEAQVPEAITRTTGFLLKKQCWGPTSTISKTVISSGSETTGNRNAVIAQKTIRLFKVEGK